jgi:hypothetical protein
MSQVPGQRWSLQLNYQGSDNAMPDHGCHTPQGAVIDEYGAMVE